MERKIVTFYRDEIKESIAFPPIYPGYLIEATPLPDVNGIRNFSCTIEGRTGKRITVEMLKHHVVSHQSWIDAHAYIKRNDPNSEYIGMNVKA